MKKIFCWLMILCFVSNLSFAQDTDQRLLPVQVDGKWGFIDIKGKVIINPQFDYADIFSEGLAAVKVGDVFGYIDQRGNTVIKPQYETAWGFHEGLATVYVNDSLCGCINKKGKMIIPPKYGRIEFFKDGIACVWLEKSFGKFSFLDKSGRLITDLDASSTYSEGIIKVHKDKEGYGFIDFTGKVIIQPQFSNAENFKEGVAVVQTVDGWGVVDKTGKYIIPEKKDYFLKSEFSEGMIGVRINKKWGFLDITGSIKITPQFDEVDDFHDGLAKVKKDGDFGFIDKSGNVVKWLGEILYAGRFDNGVAIIHTIDKKQRNKRECYILLDKTGNQIGKNLFYREVNGFFDGIAAVKNEDGEVGYIDLTGNQITDLIFTDARPCRDGIAKVYIGTKIGYIDKTGKYIWEPSE